MCERASSPLCIALGLHHGTTCMWSAARHEAGGSRTYIGGFHSMCGLLARSQYLLPLRQHSAVRVIHKHAARQPAKQLGAAVQPQGGAVSR